MAGNTYGVLFRVTTWGESHGRAIGAVVDGCPPGIPLHEDDIQGELDRRRPGTNPLTSSRREEDRVAILSGTFEGKTTGTPIALLIENRDADSGAYDELRDVFRPGHGDYTYLRKYGLRDHRGGGRASGRETAARVAAGAVAKKVIMRAGMEVLAYTAALGGIAIDSARFTPGAFARSAVVGSALRCPDDEAARRMEEKIEVARRRGDSLGGIVEIVVRGCPPGLGEPVFDKLDGELAKALMGIGTVKGVEIGAGFRAADMWGSEANDPLGPQGFLTNHAGGVLAGIANGADIVLRAACKPIPSIALPQETVDIHGYPRTVTVTGRHDVCVIPRIVPVCEAMVSLVLADHLLRQKAIAP
jgi:chorismate synthase